MASRNAALVAALIVFAGVVSHVVAAEDIKVESIDRKVGNITASEQFGALLNVS